jgi:hypothetical protein
MYSRTTPVRALEVDTAFPPTSVQFDYESRRYAERLHRISPTSPVSQRLPAIWQGTPPKYPPPLPLHKRTTRKRRRVVKTTRLVRTAALTDVRIEKIRLSITRHGAEQPPASKGYSLSWRSSPRSRRMRPPQHTRSMGRTLRKIKSVAIIYCIVVIPRALRPPQAS